MKEFADDNFKFDKKGSKLSKWVENNVGKGEIARYENFSFSHSVFKRLVSQGLQKVSLCGNGLNVTEMFVSVYDSIKNIVRKGENATYPRVNLLLQNHNKQFLLFPQCFVPIWMTFLPFSSNLKLSSANSFNLKESKICHLGKGEQSYGKNSFENMVHWLVALGFRL